MNSRIQESEEGSMSSRIELHSPPNFRRKDSLSKAKNKAIRKVLTTEGHYSMMDHV
jgi:hypothetical protein